MQHILINEDFRKSIQKLRSILPFLSFALLITTYIISAIIMGIFHAQEAPSIGFTIAAYLVPFAIQAGRGTLVFFFQLNPVHIQGKLSFGLISATALLILSLVEAWLVMLPHGLPWGISVSTLMIIGWILEIMILKETIFATQLELFQKKDGWQEIMEFYQAKAELQGFIEELKSGKPTKFLKALEKNEPNVNEAEPSNDKALSLLEELNRHLEGKELRPSLNGQEKGQK